MAIPIGKRNPGPFPNPFIDRHPSPLGLSRRQFLASAAAAGMAAFSAPNEVLGAAQDEREREPVWKDVELTKENDQWIVNCKGKGDRCAILRLVNAKRLSPFHNAELAQYTIAINAILDEIIAKNRVPNRHPGFIVTPHAPFLAWMRTSPGPTVGRGITLEEGPDPFYQALGLSLESYREKPPTRFWYSIGGDKCGCKKGGDTQKVARLLEAERLSPLHDTGLKEYTNRLNVLLDRCAKGNRNPTLNLSLFVTPKGLFLAWSEDDDREGPLPRGAITALHEEEKVLQALGI